MNNELLLRWETLFGYRAEVRKNNAIGILVGYVFICPEDTNYSKYVDVDFERSDIVVHGGVTFYSKQDDGVIIIGFDCGHFTDIMPSLQYSLQHRGATFKDTTYVALECESVAYQLAYADF